ncbi:hypothetical protein NCS55_01254900 [Fusarium keratoplasticum]|nr:hypothetical protein NCS55_01254900 [Fusarium keratoplasticum]
MSNINQLSKADMDNLNSEERLILAQVCTRTQRDVGGTSTPDINDVEMSTPASSPQKLSPDLRSRCSGTAHMNISKPSLDWQIGSLLDSQSLVPKTRCLEKLYLIQGRLGSSVLRPRQRMGVFKLSLEYLALGIAASYQLIPRTTCTTLTSAAFDEKADYLNTRLAQIELQPTKALESYAKEIERQAGEISEMDELIVTCGKEFSCVESDADNASGMLLRFERQIEEHAARQDAKLNELAKTDSNATRLAAIEARLARLEEMMVGLMNNQNTEKLGNMAV